MEKKLMSIKLFYTLTNIRARKLIRALMSTDFVGRPALLEKVARYQARVSGYTITREEFDTLCNITCVPDTLKEVMTKIAVFTTKGIDTRDNLC